MGGVGVGVEVGLELPRRGIEEEEEEEETKAGVGMKEEVEEVEEEDRWRVGGDNTGGERSVKLSKETSLALKDRRSNLREDLSEDRGLRLRGRL